MSTCSQSSLEMCDFVPNIPSVYNVTHPFFFNVGQILNCILYCSTAFKVLKNPLQKKLKKCLKGGGGVSKLQTKSEVLCFSF